MRRQAPTEDLRQRVIDSIPLRRMGNAAEHRRVGAGRRLCQRSRPGHRFVKRGLLNPTVRAESLAMVRREHDEGVLAQPRGVERTFVSGLIRGQSLRSAVEGRRMDRGFVLSEQSH
jgi:hypothetical protein